MIKFKKNDVKYPILNEGQLEKIKADKEKYCNCGFYAGRERVLRNGCHFDPHGCHHSFGCLVRLYMDQIMAPTEYSYPARYANGSLVEPTIAIAGRYHEELDRFYFSEEF